MGFIILRGKLSSPLLWLPVIYDANRTNVSVFSSLERLRRLMQHQNHMSEEMRSSEQKGTSGTCVVGENDFQRQTFQDAKDISLGVAEGKSAKIFKSKIKI